VGWGTEILDFRLPIFDFSKPTQLLRAYDFSRCFVRNAV